MFKTTLAALSGAALIAATLASPVVAQTPSQPTGSGGTQATQQDRQTSRSTPRQAAESQGRIRTPRRQRQAAPPDPAAVLAEAQAVLTRAGNACVAAEATFMGQDTASNKVYEVTCGPTSPGYIVVDATPPATPELLDCVLLAGQAETARLRDPAAETETCKMPGNQNALAVISAYAASAGITCSIDQAASVGKNGRGDAVFEVGCNGADGYWMEQAADGSGWTKTECTQIVAQNATCRYTTTGEIAASFKARLADSAANDCDVTQVRFMGANANGRFYEAKCAAEGTGYIARTDVEGAVQQVYACATAQRIGGGCQLTTVGAAAAPAPSSE